ncbi:MAG TPA: fumarylacetoacetase [Dermatophilaceae bacterium]|nr:fumarylacetoacetase [Dermatophilaceae bacterium]
MTTATSWLDLPKDHAFGLATLPYGVFSGPGEAGRRIGVRIGDLVLDAAAAAAAAGADSAVWQGDSLNVLMDRGADAWAAARAWATEALSDPSQRAAVEPHLHPLDAVTLHLPIVVADYVDCYASEHHATNVGKIFRPDSPALPVNWKHIPIGYHGRSGTIVVSGTDVMRPAGQRKGPQDPAPVFGPSIRLDIEAELGFVVAGATRLGEAVPLDDAESHIFGVVVLNDWSARDIQAWEYVPLGPFLGKSFATSISAWVTPLAALQDAKCELPGQDDPLPLPYLRSAAGAAYGLDVHLEVDLNGTVVARPEYRDMYWSPTQMLAHMTVNGATLRTGDLYGSGTISGPEKHQRGSFLELAWGGQEPFALDDGSTRTFLEDGDVVTLRAWADGPDGTRIGLGDVVGRIVPNR